MKNLRAIVFTDNGVSLGNREITKKELEEYIGILSGIDDTDIQEHNIQIDRIINEQHDLTYREDEYVREIGYVYLIKIGGLYKLGRCKSLKRLKSYSTHNPFGYEEIKTIKSDDYVFVEKFLLNSFHTNIVKGKEWMSLDSNTLSEILTLMDLYESK